jgi:hypothetical protein
LGLITHKPFLPEGEATWKCRCATRVGPKASVATPVSEDIALVICPADGVCIFVVANETKMDYAGRRPNENKIRDPAL